MDYFFGFLIGGLIGLTIGLAGSMAYGVYRVRKIVNQARDKAVELASDAVKDGAVKVYDTYKERVAK